ncbi:MAG: hypothetical protein JNG84_08810 [Archangium sp.]|nr:hypothetical protein [Archangium sp.]
MKTLRLALLLLPALAHASLLDVMSAHPDAPAMEAGWRGALRAKLGARIPLIEPKALEAGWLLDVPAFMELHNVPGAQSLVPYQLWRARISVGGGYRWARWLPWLASLKLTAEHESDHATVPNQAMTLKYSGFVTLNSVALTAVAQRAGPHPTSLELTNRLHLLSCTISMVNCGATNGHGGGQTWELAAAATQRFTLDEASRWVAFASVAGDVLVPTAYIAPGSRFTARAGLGFHRDPDWWTLSLTLLAGKDVGLLRQLDVVQFGLALAWTPFT